MFSLPHQSKSLADAMSRAFEMTDRSRDEFLTPEILLWAISWQPQFLMVASGTLLSRTLSEYIGKYQDCVPENAEYEGAMPSYQFTQMINIAYEQMTASQAPELDVPHIINAIFRLDNSFARTALEHVADGHVAEFMSDIVESYSQDLDFTEHDFDDSPFFGDDDQVDLSWRQYVTCLNDHVNDHNPLIGREYELERTVQILCRKDKNNPLHVGEPGVGKTALAFGLAARIESDDVPERLMGCHVYELDMGSLIAGTQFRGDFEKRLKMVLQGLSQEGKVILYIDEIHTVIGAGRTDGSTLDASNLLKRYLEDGKIRFMGSTTYDEYNKSFMRSKGFARRFEKIDIEEPSVEECKVILEGLKEKYEAYHGVKYTPDAIEFAVIGSAKYITGRYLPDKAIDLIDEAGAWRVLHPESDVADQIVDRKIIADVLARICHVETLAEKDKDHIELEHLEDKLKAKIYGQDHAIRQVTEAVMLGSAGLIDDNKPMASLLFVGPTGVGKTEVARVLAHELGLPLLRFDMSEYAERHTVAKLIGSPAGYVGYEDGGLLTDAIRKSPHCVLLFDEIEKAHQDIYNILLQVMDYAVLTDNKGQKADFRHVIFIMTTNSGAQYAHQSNLGFVKGRTAGEAMLKSVKQTFKPEFINRLTDITVFNDMDRTMASMILDKKLGVLRDKLATKGVALHIDTDAMDWLLKEGFSAEYGGREIERVINANLKPMLTRAMLFGSLKGGGEACVHLKDDKLMLE